MTTLKKDLEELQDYLEELHIANKSQEYDNLKLIIACKKKLRAIRQSFNEENK